MKRTFLTLFISALTLMASSQTKVLLTVGGKSMTATLADNEATRTLAALLESSPVTVSMEDYGGFEKVGALPRSLPTSNSQITTVAGDIMLYQGNNIVIFYGSNSWSYTRLGKIDDATAAEIREFLGSGDIDLTISLSKTGIKDVREDAAGDEQVYDLGGRPVTRRPLHPGIYIIGGVKTVIR